LAKTETSTTQVANFVKENKTMSKSAITPGVFEEDSSLMSQLSLLTTKRLAKKWWKEYLAYHKGVDQGVSYVVGYFSADKASELREWFKL
jgi:hypothetical protein